jgi:hypothetical protein
VTPFERSAVDRRALRSVHSGELWPRRIVMLYDVLAECPSRLTETAPRFLRSGSSVRLRADLEPGWFWSKLLLDGPPRRSWLTWGEVVLVEPACQWLGEASVVAAGVLELAGGVDEGGG